MKKYGLCIISFVIAACLLFAGIFMVAAQASDTVETYYTVGFNTYGGSYIESVHIRKGGKVPRPEEDPVKEGFIFAGWYTGSHYTTVYDFNTPVESSMSIFAKWEVDRNYEEKLAQIKLDFKDVVKGKWYYDDVAYVFDKGLMNGISKTEFNPDGDFTRAMFVTVLYRMQKSPSVNSDCPFTDVKAGSYYRDAVIWAYKNEIVNGISETEFAPDTPITREQMAVIMYRYAKFARMDTKLRGKLEVHVDYLKIAKYAEDAVLWATKNKVMWSNTEGYFEPKRNATRAEAAAVFTVMHRDMR
ncbi:MAG: S-layer homology domain-containing protein [Clostridia bacterium]|nr:S-layer homology domain-containing protein [Clostridia bacterium]